MRQKSNSTPAFSETLVRNIRRATRKHHAAVGSKNDANPDASHREQWPARPLIGEMLTLGEACWKNGNILMKRGLCVSRQGPLVHGHLKTEDEAVSSARDTRLEKFGVADPESRSMNLLMPICVKPIVVRPIRLVLHRNHTIAHQGYISLKELHRGLSLHRNPVEDSLIRKEVHVNKVRTADVAITADDFAIALRPNDAIDLMASLESSTHR